MADVSVNGWIAEGGHTIIEGKNNNIILFDVVESVTPVNGIDDDVFNNNKAWFHCSFEINLDKPANVTFIPTGYTLQRIQSNGWAWIVKKGTQVEHLIGDWYLYGEQVADYIQEGNPVCVKGREYLLKDPDGKLFRMIDVTEIWFGSVWVQEKPKLLKVPYKSGIYISKSYPASNEGNK